MSSESSSPLTAVREEFSDALDSPVRWAFLVAPLVAAVGLLPLAVLFSYAIRLAVVSQRTIAITPFTTPEQEEELNL